MKTKLSPTVRLLLAVLMCLPVWCSHAFAQESYAVFDEATNTLTFKHDTNKPEGAFALNESEYGPNWGQISIKKVVFDASFANARPTTCRNWFFRCEELEKIEGIENLNTQNVTDMSCMFLGCTSLTSLDLSKFDTQNVTDMNRMFFYCENLTTLDLSNFNTRKVTDMFAMFYNCWRLTSLNLSNFNTQNVTDMSKMFYSCEKLTSLDLSNFNTQNVTKIEGMFQFCKGFNTLDLSSFNTQNVTSMSDLFYDCVGLRTLNLSSFNTQNVTNMFGMFMYCWNLTTLDLSNFNTQNVTDMSKMFNECVVLTTIYASDMFVTTAVEEGNDTKMFKDCPRLVGAVAYDENKVGKEMANYTTGYFTYKTSGIDDVEMSDNTTAEYYDLQGRRLNAPQKGINIVKRGKKTTKILVE